MMLRRLFTAALMTAAMTAAVSVGAAPAPQAVDPAASSKADVRVVDSVAVDSVVAPKLTPAEADTVNRAYATVMAAYLAPYIASEFPGNPEAAARFIEGMRHAYAIRDEVDPYFAGVRSAMANFDRIDAMASMGFPIDPKSYIDALDKALAGDTYGLNSESADEFLRRMMSKMYPAPEPLTPESQQACLDAQAAREGVQKLPSGLLFEVLTEGEGVSPTPADVARVLYKGALADGTVFDETDRPIDLPVNGVVPGVSAGLQLMKPGGKYRLFIPASLGYGDRGAGGGTIPPGAALDFTVTLLDVIPQ